MNNKDLNIFLSRVDEELSDTKSTIEVEEVATHDDLFPAILKSDHPDAFDYKKGKIKCYKMFLPFSQRYAVFYHDLDKYYKDYKYYFLAVDYIENSFKLDIENEKELIREAIKNCFDEEEKTELNKMIEDLDQRLR